MPQPGQGAEIVLHHMHPMNESEGFSSEIDLALVVNDGEKLPVRNVLNVGSRAGKVRRNKGESTKYEVHGDVHAALASLRARWHLSGAPVHPQLGYTGMAAPAFGGNLKAGTVELPPQPRVQVAGPRQPQSGNPAPLPMSVDEQNRLRGDYWGHCLAAIGVNAHAATARLDGEGVEQAAAAAWRALDHLARGNRRLGQLLDNHRNAQEDALGQTYSSLKAGTGGDQARIELLDGIDNEVQNLLPALMLFPENGLIGYLIEELERGFEHNPANFPVAEQALVTLLRQIKWDLDRADLSKAQEWNRITDAIVAHNKIVQIRPDQRRA